MATKRGDISAQYDTIVRDIGGVVLSITTVAFVVMLAGSVAMLVRANTRGSGSMKIDKGKCTDTRNSVMANQLWYTCSYTGMVDGKAVRVKRRQDDRVLYDKPFDVYWMGTLKDDDEVSPYPPMLSRAQENVFSVAFIALSVYIVYEIAKKRNSPTMRRYGFLAFLLR